jgi:hypothetical protein
LRDAVAEAFVEALPSFKKREPLAFSYLKYVPGEGDVSDAFFRRVLAECLSRPVPHLRELAGMSPD